MVGKKEIHLGFFFQLDKYAKTGKQANGQKAIRKAILAMRFRIINGVVKLNMTMM